ncbi:hypothetical protein EIP91_006510 [Steccherinum ochraceum]|uniref:Uncharacterized protein n=1 Tax=Steccherinum ochraceum TaxID=92696 RepID=A0A4R0RR87_9APHY|nr:hypothetical protein EIP91_006510 [Steccherinum ochraceum]
MISTPPKPPAHIKLSIAMLPQLPWDKTYLVATWIETLVYGFFLCLFFATVYTHFTYRRSTDGTVMFGVGCVLFVFATIHLAMNCYRLIRGYVDFATAPGGAAAYLSRLAPWDHVFKDTIYATTELLGDAISIYRCWIVWERNWKVIVLPVLLLIVSIISGYTVCGLYTTINTDSVFDHRLSSWVSTFYAVAVVQSSMTTGLMMYRIWQAEKRSASYRTGKSPLRPVLWILLESAALLVVVEIVLLALYSADYNCQYLLLEPVTPIVGITFTSITLRITLRSREGRNTGAASSSHGRAGADTPFPSMGTVPMRPIAINITKDVEASLDPHPTGSDDNSYAEDQKDIEMKHR